MNNARSDRVSHLDSRTREALDRLTRLAARMLNAPMALAVLIDADRQILLGSTGLPEPWASTPDLPRDVAMFPSGGARGEPFLISDVRQDSRTRDLPLARALGTVAYAGVPLCLPSGQTLGTFCVADGRPRTWTDDDAAILEDFAASAVTEIELRTAAREADEARVAMERARAEAEVARQHLHDLFMQAPALIAVTRGPDHRIELLNAGYVKIVGRRNPSELVGRFGREAIPELGEQGFFDLMDEVYRTGRPFIGKEVPVKLDRKGDGTLDQVILNFVCQPSRNAQGAVDGMLIHGVEVTEQVRARQRAEELSERLNGERVFLETVLRQMQAGVVIAEAPSGRLILSNKQVERIWRHPFRSATTVDEDGHYQGFHRDGRPYRPDDWPLVRSLRNGEVITAEEIEILRGDGTRGALQVGSAPIRDREGRIVAAVAAFDDVTEQVRARQRVEELVAALATERDQLQAEIAERRKVQDELVGLKDMLAAQLADMTRLHELSVRLSTNIDLNSVLAEVLRAVTAIERSGKGLLMLFDRERQELYLAASVGMDDRFLKNVGRIPLGVGAAGHAVAEHRPVIVEDNETDPIAEPFREPSRLAGYRAVYSTPLITLEGDAVGVISICFQEPHRPSGREVRLVELYARHAAELIDHARLYRQAQDAIRARDEFLSVAAHELKTPMTSLRLAAQATVHRMDKGGGIDPERVRAAFHSIDEQTIKLAHLVAQLLDVSRIDAGKLILERSVTNVSRIVRDVVAVTQERTNRRAIEVRTPDEVSALVDPLRLEQVVTNLVDNAVKYSPDETSIEVELSRPSPGVVHLVVRDHGYGIPAEHRDHIFDRFYQAHGSSYRSGMGLGLYISQQIVQFHGGTITADFPDDGGTRIVVTLPVSGDG